MTRAQGEVERAAQRGWRAVGIAEGMLQGKPNRAEVKRTSLIASTAVTLVVSAVVVAPLAYYAGAAGATRVVEQQLAETPVRPVSFAALTADPGRLADAEELCESGGGEFYRIGVEDRPPIGYVCFLAANEER